MGDIGIMAKELDLKYPEQTYTGKLKQAKIIEKRRTDLISDVSGKTQERNIETFFCLACLRGKRIIW